MSELLNNIWMIYLDTAVWLLFGLFLAGLVKAYIPQDAMQKWLGGSGIGAVGRAALFGAPLPLCSCGVLPAAIGLRRAGASREATVSFLISTPETSVDSVAVTYALMGPIMAVYRPVAALASAISTGIMVSLVKEEAVSKVVEQPVASCCEVPAATSGCCSASEPEESCCESKPQSAPKLESRFKRAIYFAGVELLDDISLWMAFGIVFAGIMITVIPPGWLAQWGGGLPAMLVMLVVGIPMYICAVASTPVAAGMLLAGVSPGAVLVFLLVGPATNIASLMLIRQELGNKVTAIYLSGIAGVSLLMGLLLEYGLAQYALTIEASIQPEHSVLPYSLSLFSALLLLLLVVPAVRRRVFPFLHRS